MAREATIKTKLVLEGEKEYKAAISGANQELKTLKSELAATTSAMGKNGSEQKKAVATVKSLNQQIDVQKKKVDTLKKAVDESTKTFGENGKKTLEYRQKLADATTELNKMTQAQQAAKAAANDLGEKLKQPFEGLLGDLPNALGDTLDTIGGKFDQFAIAAGAAFTGVLATVTATAGEIVRLENETAQYADDLLTQSATSGLDTDTLQEWMYASNFMDVSVDSMLNAVKKLRKGMTSGNDDIEKLFRQLGVRTTDGAGHFRDAIDVFWDAVDVLHDAEGRMDETTQGSIMQQLFGNSYTDLLPLIQGGREMWQGYGQQAQDNAFVLDADTVALYGQINDHLDGIKSASAAIRRSVAGIFAHDYEKLTGNVEKVATSFNKWLNGDEDTDTLVANIEQLYSDAETAVNNGLESLGGLAGKLQESDNDALVIMGNAIQAVVNGFQWVMDHKDELAVAFNTIGVAIAAVKIAEFIAHFDPVTGGIAIAIAAITEIITHWDDIVKGIENAIEKLKIFLGLQENPNAVIYDDYTEFASSNDQKISDDQRWAIQNYVSHRLYDSNDIFDAREEDAIEELRNAFGEKFNVQSLIVDLIGKINEGWDEDAFDAWLDTKLPLDGEITDASKVEMQNDLINHPMQQPIDGVLTGVDGSALTTGNGIPGFASGIDYVPRDNLLAFLHKGETVLPAPEAAAYRNGGGMSGMNIANVLASVLSNVRVQIDGESAGRLLAPTVSHYIVAEGI